MIEQKNQQTADKQARKGEMPGATPSGYTGENPATAGPGPTGVKTDTPENEDGKLNPSAPANVGTTPGSTETEHE